MASLCTPTSLHLLKLMRGTDCWVMGCRAVDETIGFSAG